MKNDIRNIVIGFFLTGLIGCGAEVQSTPDATTEASTTAEETTVEDETPVEVSKELTAFNITAPVTTATTNAKPTVTWTESDYADTTSLSLVEDVLYDLKITSDTACATVVQEYKDLTDLTKTLTTDLAEGTFYACVNSKSQGEAKSATNNAYKLTVDLLPQAFTLAAVTSTSATGATHSISLSWGASTNASYYLVTTDSTQATTQLTTTTATVSVAATKAGTSHSVLITAYDAQSNSLASNTVTFTAARLYALSELGSTYTVGANARAKSSTHDSDVALGSAYTCSAGATVDKGYLYSDGVIFDFLNGNIQTLADIATIQASGYTCVAD